MQKANGRNAALLQGRKNIVRNLVLVAAPKHTLNYRWPAELQKAGVSWVMRIVGLQRFIAR